MNTVSRRFGISTLTSLRLFTRAPCTRIRSWLSAACGAGDCVAVLRSAHRASSCRPMVGRSIGPGSGLGRPRSTSQRRRASARGRTARSPRARPGCGAGRCGTSGTGWPARAGRNRCARRTGHPARRGSASISMTSTSPSIMDTSRVWPSPSRTARAGGQIPAGRAVGRRGHQQRLAVPVEGQRHQVRRTVRRGAGHPDVDVVGEPVLGVATALGAGAGVGAHRSWSSPRTLPSGSVTVATRRPPPTSCAASFTVAPAAVTSASFASMSGTCQ